MTNNVIIFSEYSRNLEEELKSFLVCEKSLFVDPTLQIIEKAVRCNFSSFGVNERSTLRKFLLSHLADRQQVLHASLVNKAAQIFSLV